MVIVIALLIRPLGHDESKFSHFDANNLFFFKKKKKRKKEYVGVYLLLDSRRTRSKLKLREWGRGRKVVCVYGEKTKWGEERAEK
jgi:hypothetical protein